MAHLNRSIKDALAATALHDEVMLTEMALDDETIEMIANVEELGDPKVREIIRKAMERSRTEEECENDEEI